MGKVFYTDYPFHENDTEGEEAPIRPVNLISYDGDKYVTILYTGNKYEFKAGYLYTTPGRSGRAPCLCADELMNYYKNPVMMEYE